MAARETAARPPTPEARNETKMSTAGSGEPETLRKRRRYAEQTRAARVARGNAQVITQQHQRNTRR